MFERTKSGQQNRAKMLNVSYICYIEGGNGTDNTDHAPDITFWRNTLTTLRPDITVRFVPRGGKPILEKLAEQIIQSDISNVLVAMDSDYDIVDGNIIDDHRVLYTFGHSWENDVFCLENMLRSYVALCHCASLPGNVEEFLRVAIAKLHREIYWPVQADYVALINGTSVFPREKPGRIVQQYPKSGGVWIEKNQVLKYVAAAKTKKKREIKVSRISDIGRHCVGHIYDLAMIYIIRAAAKQFGRKTSVSPDHIRDVCLQTFSSLLSDSVSELCNHHRQQLQRF